jgi:hypothetical protein
VGASLVQRSPGRPGTFAPGTRRDARLADVDSSSEKIDALPSEAEHLAESQAAERCEQHERSVRLVDLIGELPDVVGVEESHLPTLD